MAGPLKGLIFTPTPTLEVWPILLHQSPWWSSLVCLDPETKSREFSPPQGNEKPRVPPPHTGTKSPEFSPTESNHVPVPFGNPRETTRHASRAIARDACRALPLNWCESKCELVRIENANWRESNWSPFFANWCESKTNSPTELVESNFKAFISEKH